MLKFTICGRSIEKEIKEMKNIYMQNGLTQKFKEESKDLAAV